MERLYKLEKEFVSIRKESVLGTIISRVMVDKAEKFLEKL